MLRPGNQTSSTATTTPLFSGKRMERWNYVTTLWSQRQNALPHLHPSKTDSKTSTVEWTFNPQQRSYLLEIPLELLQTVFLFLELESFCNIQQCCKFFREKATSPDFSKLLWKSFCLRDFSKSLKQEDISVQEDWKQAYRLELKQCRLLQPLSVSLEQIIGMEKVKMALTETIVIPHKFPHLFSGLRAPHSCILLFGHEGVGKSLLCHAIATTAGLKLLHLSLDGFNRCHPLPEDLIKFAFQLAQENQPCLFVLDGLEVESPEMMPEHSRRGVTELLMTLESRFSAPTKKVIVIALSNQPWNLGYSIRRRMEKRIYIPLPTVAERLQLLQKWLQKEVCDDLQEVANKTGDSLPPFVKALCTHCATEGFTAMDLFNLAREMQMNITWAPTIEDSSVSPWRIEKMEEFRSQFT